MIRIPKLLRSLSTLVTFRLGTHLREEIDQQRLEVRSWSKLCLYYIQIYGDEQDQSELINMGYGRVISITYSTAGGNGEEQDDEIQIGLIYIYDFLKALHQGRNYKQSSFQPLPLLARNTEEQIEEEGANEEIDAQIKNKGINGDIKNWAKGAKAAALNRFIYS
ncbi:MAG: hypothetical protein EZS28_039545 [Streblomastix strix]|uniref:Uncharacterized protein n=1 Tax=Streblomastix strix TaxID=222440 RepID=A0A5J4U3Q6_9EUKA|nr:MAG: hypothetical protein EZS28_039545 [Streblomastix strix]